LEERRLARELDLLGLAQLEVRALAVADRLSQATPRARARRAPRDTRPRPRSRPGAARCPPRATRRRPRRPAPPRSRARSRSLPRRRPRASPPRPPPARPSPRRGRDPCAVAAELEHAAARRRSDVRPAPPPVLEERMRGERRLEDLAPIVAADAGEEGRHRGRDGGGAAPEPELLPVR